MVSLISTPCEHNVDHGKTAGAKSKSSGKAVFQMIESDVPACERHPSLIRHEAEAERSPDGVLKVALQQQKVRSSEAIVLIAAQRRSTVNVLSTQRLLEIERHYTRSRSDRFRKQKT